MFYARYKTWLLASFLTLICANLEAAPPNWSVTPSQFQYSMNISAQVVLNGATVQTGSNLIGAFVGGQCRGIGSPVMVGNQAIYFFTVFSNLTSGETVTFQFYHAPTDLVFTAIQTTPFIRNSVIGSVTSTYLLTFATGNDYPIGLSAIPNQFTILGQPFAPVSLSPYLQTIDHDPVAWTAAAGQSLQSQASGGSLTVTPLESDFLGSDTVRLTATETGTAAAYHASKTITYTVRPDYSFYFKTLPQQFIQPGGVFPGFDLDDYLHFSGTCRQFDFEMMPFVNSTASPAWLVAPPGNGTMSIICKVRFGASDLAATGCKLGAFINGQLRGVASPTFSGGSYWYFLVVNNGTVGNINFQFYDAANHNLYNSPSNLTFAPNTTAGTVAQPHIIQLAPLDVQVATDGKVIAPIRDASWMGTQKVRIVGWDCDFASTKRDTGYTYFIIDPAYNGAPVIYTPTAINFLEKSCFVLYDAGAFDNLNSEGNGLTYSIIGGADQPKFSIDPSSGILAWNNFEPDFEIPGDANGDNVYEVAIKVVDQDGLSDSKTLLITIIDNAVETFTPTITGNPVICVGATTTLKANNAASYLWSTGEIAPRIYNLTVGDYTVTATNRAGCTATVMATVVYESTPPTITCPANLTATMDVGLCSAVVPGIDAVFGDNCPGAHLAYATSGHTTLFGAGQASGLPFNLGTNTITYTVTDAVALTASCSFTVTVSGTCLQGKIQWENDLNPVKNVSVALGGAGAAVKVTDANGIYNLAVPETGDFTITPEKYANFLNGITVADVTRIQQHVVGMNPLTSPYKLIAADVNGSSSISSFDATLVNQALLGNPNVMAHIPKFWRFVPTSHAFSNPTVPWGFPETIQVTGATGLLTGNDFIGIKIGDVDGTASPQLNPITPLVWVAEDQVLTEGQPVSVTFRASHFNDIAAWQFSLAFDPSKMQLTGIEAIPTGLNLQAGNFGTYNVVNGEIRAVWNATLGQSLAEETEVFRLNFMVQTGDVKLSEILHLDNSVLEGLAYNTQLEQGDVQLVFRETTNTASPALDARMQLLQNRPNPFSERTAIGFILPEACEAQIRVFDVQGRLLEERSKLYGAGYQEESFLMEAEGVLYYELTTVYGQLVRKMTANVR
jgi:hypothetical protein